LWNVGVLERLYSRVRVWGKVRVGNVGDVACAWARLQVKKEIWQEVRDATGEEHFQLRAVGERSEGRHRSAAGPR
jgi:hypothetical protein